MHEKIVTNNGVVIVPTVEIEDIGNQKFRVYGVLEQSKITKQIFPDYILIVIHKCFRMFNFQK